MSKLTSSEAINAEINGTLSLLDTKYSIDESLRKNVILFVGLTGSGKSTLCQFLAGNPNLKIAQNGGAGDFYITDGNDKVSEDTTTSKTLLPELLAIPNTDIVLADCPGFSDTRSAKHDIAAASFTKKLLDESEKVKIMVTVSHHSVRKGVDRVGFTDLLAHLAHFIKDIEKYKDSIGLVVTKVENQYKEDDDGNNILIPDSVMVNEIGSFLVSTKMELMTKPQSSLIIKQIQLIDILIVKNGKHEFSKIGIFRRPSKIGNIDSNKRMTANKNAIKNIVNHVIKPSQVATNDFGLSLSADSKFIVARLRETLNINLSNILDDYIRVYSQQPQDIDNIESMKISIQRFITIVDQLESTINPNMVVTQMMNGIYLLDPGHPAQQYYAEWKSQQTYMQLLQSLTPTNKQINDFNKYNTKIVDFKRRLSNNIKLMGRNAEKIIDQLIDTAIKQVVLSVKNELFNLEASSHLLYSELVGKMDEVYMSCDQFKTNNQEKRNLSFKEFYNSFKSTIKISEKHAQQLKMFQTDIEFFKSKVTVTFTDGHQNIWLQGFTVPLNDIKKALNWYSFIADSYAVLIDYDNNIAISDKNTFLKNWEDFKRVRKSLEPSKALNMFLESRPTLSGKEQADLDNLMDAVQSSFVHTCSSSKLIVKGNVVRLSDVKIKCIPGCASFKELYIFATQTVFIDDSLTEPTKNVYIIAPTWHIYGNRLIDLRGLDGLSEVIAQSGGPGQPGGNFVGIGDKFVNGQFLTIDVSGGNGGNGKDGDDGQNGLDGITPYVPKTTIWHDIFSYDNCEYRIRDERDWEGRNFGYSYKGSDIYRLFGKNATQGLDGGDGCKPGYGAKPGAIVVNSSKIIKQANIGKNGVPGRGGKGGKGGEHAETRQVKCHKEVKLFEWKYRYTYENILLENNGHAENGVDGISNNIGVPVPATEPTPFETQSAVAMQYKQFAQQKQLRFIDSLGFINGHVSNKRKRSAPAINAVPMSDVINWRPQPLAIKHESGNLETRPRTAEFSVSSFVALADVLLRKLMKAKSKNVESRADPDWENLLVQAEVMKIVEKCEIKWNGLNQDEAGRKPFDPLCLQKELTGRLRRLAGKSQKQQIEAEVFGKIFA